MKVSALALGLLFAVAPGRAEADSWVGPDKPWHLGGGALLGASGYALGAAFGESERARLLVGGVLVVGVASAWEVSSLLGRGGSASFKDFGVTVVGGAAVLVICHFAFGGPIEW